jgi:hypothetical protein
VLDGLASVESALVARLSPDWVGVVGSGVLIRDGRPLPVRFARLRRSQGTIWVAVWFRMAGVKMGMAPDEVWEGDLPQLPAWLAPVVPDWPDVDDADVDDGTFVSDGPATLSWRRDPSIAAPAFRVPIPEEAAFRDVVEIAAGLLTGRFEETGTADPTVVVWSGGELCGWWAQGAQGAQQAHALGRRIARDAHVQAVGMFGLGQDPVDGTLTPMVALAMEDRELGPVVWVRHFDPDPGPTRWLEDSGHVRAPGPRLGWFER